MASSASTEVSSSVIDERRAQQLMERALAFAERGDLQSAVLSCQQAISLAPESAQSHSILGFLLERSGDTAGAIAAYETVIQLAPDSQLERESLSRLRRAAATRNAPTGASPVSSVATSTPAAGIPAASATTPFTTDNAQGVGPVGVPLDLPVPKPPEPSLTIWKKLRLRPTSYFRGVPLAGATALSLLFLLWANNFAASRNLNQPPPVAPTGETLIERPPGAPDPFATRPNTVNPNVANPNAPAPVTPAAGSPATSTAVTTTNNPAPANPSGVNPAGRGAASGSTAPTAPAGNTSAAPGSAGTATPADDGETLTTQPAPVRPATPGTAPAGVNDNGGASPRGGPLGPTGSPARGYDRVAPVGGPAARPENRATGEERAANEEARSGRPDAAIERLSNSIEDGGPDVALRFQQRAQLYWQSGDATRAVSDFQSAISAYNDMIARNDRVGIARAGIAACRRGIQMAQSRVP